MIEVTKPYLPKDPRPFTTLEAYKGMKRSWSLLWLSDSTFSDCLYFTFRDSKGNLHRQLRFPCPPSPDSNLQGVLSVRNRMSMLNLFAEERRFNISTPGLLTSQNKEGDLALLSTGSSFNDTQSFYLELEASGSEELL